MLTTGNCVEPLYSAIATGTQLNTFTTEDQLQKTLPYCCIPARTIKIGTGITVRARGRLGTTGGPTFTWTLRLLTSSTWSAAGISASTAALTAGTTQTLAPWTLDVDITCRALGTGAASTLAIQGEVRSPLGLASPFAGMMPGNSGTLTAATFDNSLDTYLFLSAACGTSNSLNLIQLEMLKVFGE